MEVSSSSDSEEEVFVEETSSEESSVEKVSSTKNEARLAELKKQLMDAPGNSWAEALKKAGPKAGTPGTPACLPKESLKPLTKGNPGGRSSSSKPLKKGTPLLCKKVAIDWRGTLANDANEVSDSAIEAIEKIAGSRLPGLHPELLLPKAAGRGEGAPDGLGYLSKVVRCLLHHQEDRPWGKGLPLQKGRL